MSQLLGIINRLQNMQEQGTINGDAPQRFFERDGVRMCSVSFHQHSNTFQLEIYKDGEKPKSYQFDNIDMIAIEIYDLLN
ncbi:DUF1797 family protein [Bacillus sp. HMF5848]|uniref:YkuJ family protein n=1 Tax=Bacillus sp. HMF5848 TaxID=2495421 RepID=UPI000F7A71C6|nr:YkuJ family protein [Bacillus sp. HMF5848]RSK26846.1 DUF1797 family protein [Bacillus sp. HMF5848]